MFWTSYSLLVTEARFWLIVSCEAVASNFWMCAEIWFCIDFICIRYNFATSKSFWRLSKLTWDEPDSVSAKLYESSAVYLEFITIMLVGSEYNLLVTA